MDREAHELDFDSSHGKKPSRLTCALSVREGARVSLQQGVCNIRLRPGLWKYSGLHHRRKIQGRCSKENCEAASMKEMVARTVSENVRPV